MTARLKRTHRRNLQQLDRLARLLGSDGPPLAARAPQVSQWSVLEQIDHLIRADDLILQAIQRTLASPPPDVELRPVWIGRLVLWTGFIPRGRGKAPAPTQPAARSRPEMEKELGRVRAGVEALESRLGEMIVSPGRAAHPALGGFTAAQWLRFMDLHHEHHFKIIDDIGRQAAR